MLHTNIEDSSYPKRFILPSSEVVSAFHASTKHVVLGLHIGLIHIFSNNSDGLKPEHILQQQGAVLSLAVWDDSDTLVSAGSSCEINVWDLETGAKLNTMSGHSSTVLVLHFLTATTCLSASRDTTLRLWDLSTATCTYVFSGHTATVRGLAVRDGVAVSGSYDHDARIWNLKDGTCKLVLKGHENKIYCVAFDGKRVMTGSGDATIGIWDATTGGCVTILKGHHPFNRLDISDKSLIAASTDGKVWIWSLEDYKQLLCIDAHTCSVTALACDGSRILTGSADGIVKLWEKESGKLIKTLVVGKHTVWKAGFINGRPFAAVSEDGKAVLYLFEAPCGTKGST